MDLGGLHMVGLVCFYSLFFRYGVVSSFSCGLCLGLVEIQIATGAWLKRISLDNVSVPPPNWAEILGTVSIMAGSRSTNQETMAQLDHTGGGCGISLIDLCVRWFTQDALNVRFSEDGVENIPTPELCSPWLIRGSHYMKQNHLQVRISVHTSVPHPGPTESVSLALVLGSCVFFPTPSACHVD